MTLKRALLSLFGIAVLFGTLSPAEAQFHHRRCRDPYFRHHHPRYCHF